MSISPLERHRFHPGWWRIALFLVLATLPTFWVLLGPDTQLEAAIGTIVASTIIGLIGWAFLRWERIPARDVGLHGRNWAIGVLLFVAWWLVVTAVDAAGQAIAGLLGGSLSPMETHRWHFPPFSS